MSVHRITLTGNARGRTVQNVFHMHNQDGTLTDEQIAQEILTQWLPQVKRRSGPGCNFTFLEVRRVDNLNPPSPYITQVNVTGTGSNFNHPQVVCEKLRFQTALAGKRNRGRYYIPLVGQHGDLNDVVNAPAMVILTEVCQILTDRFCKSSGGPIGLCIWHRDTRTHTMCTSIIPSATYGIQRRRNFGIGI